jgi:hypothetical protein
MKAAQRYDGHLVVDRAAGAVGPLPSLLRSS